ncbi:hypothetical protein F53441_5006 [Fusarium austroafricanum]|uniref:Uncharacterized protein n=1 Tax=Fusarium austroafricanum TaxID=2364996 RepID=A0A8H4KL20_9HYPO|nr:hypothetical protein F53441_5006 [Fusarium austroafricanum]
MDPRITAIAGPKPSGIDLNADTATSDRAAIITVLILAALAITLRFIARHIQRTTVHWDDWVIILGMALVGGTAGLAITGKQQLVASFQPIDTREAVPLAPASIYGPLQSKI